MPGTTAGGDARPRYNLGMASGDVQRILTYASEGKKAKRSRWRKCAGVTGHERRKQLTLENQKSDPVPRSEGGNRTKEKTPSGVKKSLGPLPLAEKEGEKADQPTRPPSILHTGSSLPGIERPDTGISRGGLHKAKKVGEQSRGGVK